MSCADQLMVMQTGTTHGDWHCCVIVLLPFAIGSLQYTGE